MGKAVDKVTEPVAKAAKKISHVVEKTVKGVGETVENVYMSGRNVVEGTGHLIAGHSDEAKDKFATATDKAFQAGTNIATGGLAEGVAPKLLDKTGEAVGKATVKVVDSMIQPEVSAGKAALKLGEMAYDVVKGDWKELQKDYAKMTGNLSESIVGGAMGGTGKIIAPKLLESSKDVGEMVAN